MKPQHAKTKSQEGILKTMRRIHPFIDVYQIYTQGDMSAFDYVMRNFHFTNDDLDSAAMKAACHNHLPMLQRLHEMGATLEYCNAIYAFRQGFLDVAKYLVQHGHAIKVYRNLELNFWKKYPISVLELESVGINVVKFGLELVKIGNFHLVETILSSALTANKHAIAVEKVIYWAIYWQQTQLITSFVIPTPQADFWQKIMLRAIAKHHVEVVEYIRHHNITVANISDCFDQIHPDDSDILDYMIRHFDPTLQLRINQDQWHHVLQRGNIAVVMLYHANNAIPSTLGYDNLVGVPIMILQYLRKAKYKFRNTGRLFRAAVKSQSIENIKFYGRIKRQDPAWIVRYLKRNAPSQKVLMALADVGMDVASRIDWPSCPNRYRNHYLLNHVSNPLMWLAAMVYNRHYPGLMPSANSVPESVYGVLTVTQYQIIDKK